MSVRALNVTPDDSRLTVRDWGSGGDDWRSSLFGSRGTLLGSGRRLWASPIRSAGDYCMGGRRACLRPLMRAVVTAAGCG